MAHQNKRQLREVASRPRGSRRRVERPVKAVAEYAESAHVIGVLVSEDHGHNTPNVHAQLVGAGKKRSARNAIVHKDHAAGPLYQSGVAL